MEDKFDDEQLEAEVHEESLKAFSTYIAMCVRNAMENFHCAHLSDEQMSELNPIIRNAIIQHCTPMISTTSRRPHANT
jgi:hypothetical protein